MEEQVIFERLVRELRRDPGIESTVHLREAIETLIKITRNVLAPNAEAKFTRLRTSNPNFQEKVWRHSSAQRLLMAAGWVEEEPVAGEGGFIRLSSRRHLKQLMDVLVDNRSVVPEAREWVEGNKWERLESSEDKESEARAKATVERNKEYAAALREKEERKQLGETLRKENKSDRDYVNIRRPR